MPVILPTWEAVMGRIEVFEASLGKRFWRPYLNLLLGTVTQACHHKLCRRLRTGGL
jgi:hypothetical protein